MPSKASLKDIKSHNRRLILQTVINGQSLSRIALSRKTGLSPSTVTSLVSELLDEEVLVESGLILSTGGRGRKELKVNPAYGLIAVIEIGRGKSVLHIYDMSLNKQEEQLIAERRLSGGNLFYEITMGIINYFHGKDESQRLAGIGLLFQEDMIESDLSVMFSTSLSSDNISLKEALYTQFRVPVAGEYTSGAFLQAIDEIEEIDEIKAKNSVHLSLANTILVNLNIDGHPLKMNEGMSANISRLLSSFGNGEDTTRKKPTLLSEVAEILALLCGMFSLDHILLSGKAVKSRGFVSRVREILASILAPQLPPPIRLIESPDYNLSRKMAVQIRSLIFDST